MAPSLSGFLTFYGGSAMVFSVVTVLFVLNCVIVYFIWPNQYSEENANQVKNGISTNCGDTGGIFSVFRAFMQVGGLFTHYIQIGTGRPRPDHPGRP